MAYDDLPWDAPIEGETSLMYTYFAAFRDMGIHRNLRDLSRQLGLNGTTWLEKLSRRNHWTQRALAYDVYMDSKRREVNEAAILEMNARQAETGKLMQEKALSALRDQDPRTMTPNELARYIEAGAKLERVARGEPDSRTATESKNDGPSWADVRSAILNTRVDKADKEKIGPHVDGGEDPWMDWQLPDVGPYADHEDTGQTGQTKTDGQAQTNGQAGGSEEEEDIAEEPASTAGPSA